jgi:hypothetical protein
MVLRQPDEQWVMGKGERIWRDDFSNSPLDFGGALGRWALSGLRAAVSRPRDLGDRALLLTQSAFRQFWSCTVPCFVTRGQVQTLFRQLTPASERSRTSDDLCTGRAQFDGGYFDGSAQ